MPIDPTQRVFPWFEPEYKAIVARELAVREALSRTLPLAEILIEQSEDRVREDVLQDTADLHQRLTALEHKLDLVIDVLRETKETAKALSSIETRPVSTHQQALSCLQNASQKMPHAQSQACSELHFLYETVDGLFESVDGLHTQFAAHIQHHSKDVDAADWWKRGEEPFSDNNPF